MAITQIRKEDIHIELAGAGLAKANGDAAFSVNVDDSSIEIATDTLNVKALGVTNAMLTGSIANDKLSNSTIDVAAGNGLTGGGSTALGGTATLNIGAGDGIDVAADSIAVDVTDFIDTAAGLTETANDIQVNLDAAGGLEFNAGAIRLEAAVAGAGLTHTTGVLAVGAGDGISVAADSVAVNEGFAFDWTAQHTYNTVLPTSTVTPNADAQLVTKVYVDTEIAGLGSSLEWLDSALDYVSDNTVPPATEVTGDRYVLGVTAGAPHADYDGASAGDVVEFNGTTWDAVTPTTGTHIAIDDETTSVRFWSGSDWTQKQWEKTTASTGCTLSGYDVRLVDASLANGISVSSGTIAASLKANGGLVFESNAFALDLGASSITGTLAVADGGTGATTLTDGGVLLGSGTGAITALGQATDGQLVIGSTGIDPVLATLTAGDGVDVTNGAGSISIAVDVTDFIDTAAGLTETANDIQVNLDAAGGLEFNAGAIRLEAAVAGAGLSHTTGVLAVIVDDSSIEINADTLRIKAGGVTSAMLSTATQARLGGGFDGITKATGTGATATFDLGHADVDIATEAAVLV